MFGVCNGQIYNATYLDKIRIRISSNFFEKCDESFELSWTKHAKFKIVEIENLDQLYDIFFFVEYEDDSPTNSEHQTQWCVNEGAPVNPVPDITKGEVVLTLPKMSKSDDWYQGRGYTTKLVELKDCKRIWVEYWYYKYDGNVYDRKNPYKEAKEVSVEEFIDLMVSSRAENM